MNKRERVVKGYYKFKKRLKDRGLWGEKDNPKFNLYCFKTTGKPCSCFGCSGFKYSRKEKHLRRLI